MLAFTHLRGVLGERELRTVYRVMEEKGLRVFVDLREVWERSDERGGVGLEGLGDGSGLDD